MNGTIALKRLTSIASGSAARLRETGAMLWRYLSFSPADERVSFKKSLSVSIEKTGISVAYGWRFLSRIRINAVKSHSSEGQACPLPEEFASSVALAAGNMRAGKTEVTLCIPKAWTIIRTVELPSVVKENLADVISFELDRLTPLPAEDAFYDFGILKEADGKIGLAVIAARAETVTPYVDALREKGLTVKRITVDLSALGTLWSYGGGGKDAVLVEIDENGYEVALFREGAIAGAFSESFTADDERSMADAVMRGIESLREGAGSQGKDSQIVLYFRGESSAMKEALKARTSSLPVKILNETEVRLKLPGSQKNVPYESVGGVVESLWPKSRGLDLLSRGRHERLKAPASLTVALFIALAALWVLYFLAPLQIEGKRLDLIDGQIALKKDETRKVEALKKEIEALSGDIAAIHQFKETKPMSLNVMRELTTILPKTVWLTRVRITETTVDIEGYAGSATEMLPKLETSKLFRKAEFASPTFRDARMNADRFTIKMEIEGVKKPEEGGKNGKK